MRKFTIVSAISLLCIACLAMPASAAKKSTKKNTKKVSITFSQSTDTMENGTKFTFKTKVKNAKASKVVWKSSNSKIISINKKTGTATAKKVGKTTITATIGKKLVRRTVTVSPSVSDLINANDTYNNLKNGIFESVYSVATSNTSGNDSNFVYMEYSCLDENKQITQYQTVENSYFTYISNGKSHTLDYTADTAVVSEDFSESEHPNNNFIHYSNIELISAELNADKTYHLVYMADIDKMTEAEQASVGLDSGICVMNVTVEPKQLLVLSYTITNYGSSGSSATVVNGTFVYNEENELTLPAEIQNVITIS